MFEKLSSVLARYGTKLVLDGMYNMFILWTDGSWSLSQNSLAAYFFCLLF